MSSRMEQIIEEIEEYVDHCKPAPLSSGKILVNKEELMELISELRSKTPEEIKRYQKIISNKEAILADAQAKADHRACKRASDYAAGLCTGKRSCNACYKTGTGYP